MDLDNKPLYKCIWMYMKSLCTWRVYVYEKFMYMKRCILDIWVEAKKPVYVHEEFMYIKSLCTWKGLY